MIPEPHDSLVYRAFTTSGIHPPPAAVKPGGIAAAETGKLPD